MTLTYYKWFPSIQSVIEPNLSHNIVALERDVTFCFTLLSPRQICIYANKSHYFGLEFHFIRIPNITSHFKLLENIISTHQNSDQTLNFSEKIQSDLHNTLGNKVDTVTI